jgi:hypothetical protein
MTDKDKLIKDKLMKILGNTFIIQHGVMRVETTADYLLANNVTVVRHGKWIITKRHSPSGNPYLDDSYHISANCSECGYCVDYQCGSFGFPQINTTLYCPNCGARMIKGV